MQAKDILEESERQFYALADIAATAILIYQGEKLIYANQAASEISGYTREELLEKDYLEFIHPDFKERVRKRGLARLSGDEVPREGEMLIITKGGEKRWLQTSASTIEYRGQPAGLLEGVDITERKQAEEALKQSEEKYRFLVENINDVIISLDTQGRITYISPVIEQVSGYKVEELIGQPFPDFVHPEDLPGVLTSWEHTLAGQLEPYEMRVRDKNGNYRYVRTYGQPRFKEGKLVGTTGVMIDISERKRAEEEIKRHKDRLEELVNERTARLAELNEQLLAEIDKRQDMQEALQLSEGHFRTLIEKATDLITVLNEEGIIKYESPSSVRILGYEPEELVGRNVFELVHPDDAPSIIETFARGIQTPGKTEHVVFRYRHKDGSWRVFEATGTNLLHDPNIKGVVVNSRDITDRKLAEEALQRSERYYRSLIRNASDMVSIFEADGTVRWASPSAARITGYTPQDAYGKNILEYLHPDDIKTVQDVLRFSAEHPRVLRYFQVRFKHKDGSYHWYEAVYNNLLDDPYVQGIVVNTRHIDERKRSEERLEKLNQCFLGLGPNPMENMQKMVLAGGDILGCYLVNYCRMDRERLFTFSSSRKGDGFVQSDQARRYIGYGIISSHGDRPLIIGDLKDSAFRRDPEVEHNEFESCLGYPVRLRGDTVAAICFYFSERREFAQEDVNFAGMLAQALSIEEERLAHEEGIKSFIDIASHELRTPLSIIKGYAEAFQHGDLKDLNSLQLDKIRVINTRADKMGKIINDLLDLSRIERGQFVLEKQEVDLEPLIRRAIAEVREKGSENEFALSLSEKITASRVDPEKLFDVLFILLDNAVTYSPPGSEVSLKAEFSDEELVVSVMDRGEGVPEKYRDKIFERFFQVEEARYHSSTGIGLGLYIAKEIVEAHKGKIWHEPREGSGSIFRFTLPV